MEMQTVYNYLAIIVLVIGIALALFGRAIWHRILSGIGGMLGWMIGFGIGIWYFGYNSAMDVLFAVIIGIVCAIILGAIFATLVEAALCLLAGLLAGGAVYYYYGDMMIAIIVVLVVTVVAFILREYAISVITAIIGALLAAAAIYYLTNLTYAVMGGIILFALGTFVQFYFLEDNDNYKDD
jgi:hypothetical protein